MNIRKVKIALILCSILFNYEAMAQSEPRGEILEYGYYDVLKITERTKNPNTTSGYVNKGKLQLVKTTKVIPIEKGRILGFMYLITGLPNQPITELEFVVEHPEMTKPDGTKSTGFRYIRKLKTHDGAVQGRSGHKFDHPYEMVEGKWRFEYRYNGKAIVAQEFESIKK